MGLLGSLGKLVGKVAPKILGGLPGGGTIKTAIALGSGVLKKAVRRNAKKIIAGAAAGGVAVVAGGRRFVKSRGGQIALGTGAGMGLGSTMGGGGISMGGGGGWSGRRMNPGNTKAMRRAIRRIESGARIYSKFFAVKHGRIKGAPNVRVKKLSIRRAA